MNESKRPKDGTSDEVIAGEGIEPAKPTPVVGELIIGESLDDGDLLKITPDEEVLEGTSDETLEESAPEAGPGVAAQPVAAPAEETPEIAPGVAEAAPGVTPISRTVDENITLSRRKFLGALIGVGAAAATATLATREIGGRLLHWVTRDSTVEELAEQFSVSKDQANGRRLTFSPPRGMTIGKNLFVFVRNSPSDQWEQLDDIASDNAWSIPSNEVPAGGNLEFTIGVLRNDQHVILEKPVAIVHDIPSAR